MVVIGHYYGWVDADHPRDTSRRVPLYGCSRNAHAPGVCRYNYTRSDSRANSLVVQTLIVMSVR